MGKNKKILKKIFRPIFFLYVSIGPAGSFGGPGGNLNIKIFQKYFSGLLLGPIHNTKSNEELKKTTLKKNETGYAPSP